MFNKHARVTCYQPVFGSLSESFFIQSTSFRVSKATCLLSTGDSSFCTNHAMIHPRLQKGLEVYLQSLLFQVEFPLDLSQHLIIDAPLVAESNDGRPLGLEHLLAKTTTRRQAFTIPLV